MKEANNRRRRVKNKMEQWMMLASSRCDELHESRPSNNRNQPSTSNFGSCNLYANFIKENAVVWG